MATEERLVAIIDHEIAEVARPEPTRADALDALLDLRLRILETAAFECIECEVNDDHAARGRRSGALVSLMRRHS